MSISSYFAALIVAAVDPVRRWYGAQPVASIRRKLAVPILKFASRYSLASLSMIEPFDRADVHFTNCDSMILPSVHWFGIYGYEGVLCDYWPIFCTSARRVVEIGANIGFFTVIGSRVNPNCAYTAVEPIPENAAILRRNLALNGITHVNVVEAAVIDSDGIKTVMLNIPQERHAMTVGAFVESAAEGVSDRKIQRTIVVPAKAMTELVEVADLIKIDAEGIEYSLLAAAFSMIRERKPTIFVEVLPNSDQLKAVIARLARECGYRIFCIPAYHYFEARELSVDELLAGALERMFSKDVVLTTGPLPLLPAPRVR